MADISEFDINNTLYNLKDAEARSDIISLSNNFLNYLSLNGGTLSGSLISQQNFIIKENTYDISTSNTADDNTDRGFYVKDNNDKNLAYFIGRQSLNGDVQVMINARRLNGSSNVNNSIYLKVANDYSKSVQLSDPQAWRKALELGDNNGILPLTIAQGGTSATTRCNAVKALTNENVGSSANYFLTITNSWTKAGYTSIADAKTVLGLSNYLPLSGGTLTGILQVKAGEYTDDAATCGMDMNNSNIIKLNAIYTADAAGGASEGFNFYRDATHYDTLWIASGAINFVPNRELGTNTTAANSQKVARFTATPTTGKIVKTDGTTGGILASSLTADDIPNLNANKITTGDLTLNNSSMDSSATVSGTPNRLVGFTDKNDKYVAYIQGRTISDGHSECRILSRRVVSGSSVDNVLNLRVASDGTRKISVSESKPWRVALGANSSGQWTTSIGGTGGTDTGWKSLTASTLFTGTIYYREIGAFVCVVAYQIKLVDDLTSTYKKLLSAKLPTPEVNQAFPAGNNAGFGQVLINTSGDLYFYKEAGANWLSTRNINFSCFYMTAA